MVTENKTVAKGKLKIRFSLYYIFNYVNIIVLSSIIIISKLQNQASKKSSCRYWLPAAFQTTFFYRVPSALHKNTLQGNQIILQII